MKIKYIATQPRITHLTKNKANEKPQQRYENENPEENTFGSSHNHHNCSLRGRTNSRNKFNSTKTKRNPNFANPLPSPATATATATRVRAHRAWVRCRVVGQAPSHIQRGASVRESSAHGNPTFEAQRRRNSGSGSSVAAWYVTEKSLRLSSAAYGSLSARKAKASNPQRCR